MRSHLLSRSPAAWPLGILGMLGVLVLVPTEAAAHTGVGAAHGLLHGIAHPLLGGDHLLAMVAVGLWAAQIGGRAVWALPASFVGAMVFGGVVGAAGVPVQGVETGILLSVLVLGALIALRARMPLAAGSAAVALFALFHGHAHGAEMPAAVSGVTYGIGFTLATALLHALGVVGATRLLRSPVRGGGWVRIAGASISLAGVALWLF